MLTNAQSDVNVDRMWAWQLARNALNRRVLWHRGYQGKGVTRTNVRHGILATWLFGSTTIKKA